MSALIRTVAVEQDEAGTILTLAIERAGVAYPVRVAYTTGRAVPSSMTGKAWATFAVWRLIEALPDA